MVLISWSDGGACSSRSLVHASFVDVPAVKIGDGVPYGRKKQDGVDLYRLHRVLDLLQNRTRNCNTGPHNVFKSIVMDAGWSGTPGELEKARLARPAYAKLSPNSDPLKYKVGARPVHKRVKPADLMHYVDRVGYQINIDEAKYLIGLVDEDRRGSMGLKEFMQLLYCKTSKVLPACDDRLPRERLREVFNRVADKKHLLGKAFLEVDPKRRYNITKAGFDLAMSHALPQEPKLAEEMWRVATEGGKREVCDWRQFCQDVVDFDNSRIPSTPINLESPCRAQQYETEASGRLHEPAYFCTPPKDLVDRAVRARSPSPKTRAPLHRSYSTSVLFHPKSYSATLQRADSAAPQRADSADRYASPASVTRPKSVTQHANASHKPSFSAPARSHSATPQRLNAPRHEDSCAMPRSQSVILGATSPGKTTARSQSANPYPARRPDSRRVVAQRHAVSRGAAPDCSMRGWIPAERVPVKALAWQRQPNSATDWGNFGQSRAECVSARLWPKAIILH